MPTDALPLEADLLRRVASPGAVAVVGPARSGKSRLLRWIEHRLLDEGRAVARTAPAGTRPYAAVLALRQALAAGLEREAPGAGDRFLADVEALADRPTAHLGRWSAAIMAVALAREGPPGAGLLPVVWLLDDWGGADPHSMELVADLAAQPTVPLAVIMASERALRSNALALDPDGWSAAAPAPSLRPGTVTWHLGPLLKRLGVTHRELERAVIQIGGPMGANHSYTLTRPKGPTRLGLGTLACVLGALRHLGHDVDVGDLLTYEGPPP